MTIADLFVGGPELQGAKQARRPSLSGQLCLGRSELVDYQTPKVGPCRERSTTRRIRGGKKYPMIVYITSCCRRTSTAMSRRRTANTTTRPSSPVWVFRLPADIVFTPRQPGFGVECVTAGVKEVIRMGRVDPPASGSSAFDGRIRRLVIATTPTASSRPRSPGADHRPRQLLWRPSLGRHRRDRSHRDGQERMVVPLYEISRPMSTTRPYSGLTG